MRLVNETWLICSALDRVIQVGGVPSSPVAGVTGFTGSAPAARPELHLPAGRLLNRRGFQPPAWRSLPASPAGQSPPQAPGRTGGSRPAPHAPTQTGC